MRVVIRALHNPAATGLNGLRRGVHIGVSAGKRTASYSRVMVTMLGKEQRNRDRFDITTGT